MTERKTAIANMTPARAYPCHEGCEEAPEINEMRALQQQRALYIELQVLTFSNFDSNEWHAAYLRTSGLMNVMRS